MATLVLGLSQEPGTAQSAMLLLHKLCRWSTLPAATLFQQLDMLNQMKGIHRLVLMLSSYLYTLKNTSSPSAAGMLLAAG